MFSIKEIGVLQPIVVRPRGGNEYELMAGEGRLRASKNAGLNMIHAIICTTDDADMLRDALLENLHRADLNPLEEAAAYSQMLADFGCTQEELATRIGRSRPQVTNTMQLLKLTTSVQSKVAGGMISAGHARGVLVVKFADAKDLRRIIDAIDERSESISEAKSLSMETVTPLSDQMEVVTRCEEYVAGTPTLIRLP